jgi:Ca2+-dependent lipid-binding protein
MRTETIEDGGKTPTWNETFDLTVTQINDNITLRVMDENANANTEIGTCSIKLAAMCVNGGLESWWPIAFGPNQAGRIHLHGEWLPCGSDPVSVSAAAMPGQQTIVAQMMLAKTMEGTKPKPPPAYTMPAYNY